MYLLGPLQKRANVSIIPSKALFQAEKWTDADIFILDI